MSTRASERDGAYFPVAFTPISRRRAFSLRDGLRGAHFPSRLRVSQCVDFSAVTRGSELASTTSNRLRCAQSPLQALTSRSSRSFSLLKAGNSLQEVKASHSHFALERARCVHLPPTYSPRLLEVLAVVGISWSSRLITGSSEMVLVADNRYPAGRWHATSAGLRDKILWQTTKGKHSFLREAYRQC
jgi:hypothetical protein